jgi:two-component system, chemotaxis family, sensor kinase CheA
MPKDKPMSEMDEILKEFLLECHENLDQLDRDFVALEKDPQSREILARAFRTFHTIKGATGFLGFGRLGALAHASEDLMSHLRDGRLTLDSEITTALLSAIDAIRGILSDISTSGKEGDADYTLVIETLRALQPVRPNPKVPDPMPTALAAVTIPRAQGAGAASPAEGVVATGAGHPSADRTEQTNRNAGNGHSQSVEASSLRVGVEQLDRLMDLVGELVLTRNQLLQLCDQQPEPALALASQRLNLITSELQERIAKTRMQPIGNMWQKFPRLVRDLAVQCSKKVRLEMTGSQTELDNRVLEAIKDPLTHLLRNAIDHGIENPDVRTSVGKPAEGCVALRAFHENGQVNIEIADDGAGIDLARVRQRAVDNHLVSAEECRLMGDKDVLDLIFVPGFSTADAVTSVSGRGVGMDVVRKNIEKVGGAVEVGSHFGVGTTIRIRIPLTLAIIPALIVRSAGDLYALPQRSVVELLHLEEMERNRQIDRVQNAVGCRLRGRLTPLVFLDAELGVRQKSLESGTAWAAGRTTVVLEGPGQPFGLVVDEVVETQEIVVKPLGKLLKAMSVFAGATILGDGRVALIVDVQGLARQASVAAAADQRPLPEAESSATSAERLELLLLVDGPEERVGIPISQITRLEEFPVSALEVTEGQEVLQYGNEILPLVFVSQLSVDAPRRAQPLREGEKISVVVCSHEGERLGLVVDRVVDIVEHDIGKSKASGRAVVQSRVTRILDLEQARSSALMALTRSGCEVTP